MIPRVFILNVLVLPALQLVNHFFDGFVFWFAVGAGLGLSYILGYIRGYDRGYADMLGKVTEKLQEMRVKNN